MATEDASVKASRERPLTATTGAAVVADNKRLPNACRGARMIRGVVEALLAIVAISLIVYFALRVPPNQIQRASSGEPKPAEEASRWQRQDQAELRHLIAFVADGEHYPIITLSNTSMFFSSIPYEFGSLTPNGREHISLLGDRLSRRYEPFATTGSQMQMVRWVSTDDPRCLEAGEILLTELQLNATAFSILPPVFNNGIEDLYVHLAPILDQLRMHIPDCIWDLAEREVPDAPEDIVTLWSYLIADALRVAEGNNVSTTAFELANECVTPGEDPLPDEVFFNVTVACTPLLLPGINSLLFEILATAGDTSDTTMTSSGSADDAYAGTAEAQNASLVDEDEPAKPSNERRAVTRSLSVYDMSDYHVELLVSCLRADDAVLKRPGSGAHVLFELSGDGLVRISYMSRFDGPVEWTTLLELAVFTRRIMLCDHILRGTQTLL